MPGHREAVTDDDDDDDDDVPAPAERRSAVVGRRRGERRQAGPEDRDGASVDAGRDVPVTFLVPDARPPVGLERL
jgi:hypothetical protein